MGIFWQKGRKNFTETLSLFPRTKNLLRMSFQQRPSEGLERNQRAWGHPNDLLCNTAEQEVFNARQAMT